MTDERGKLTYTYDASDRMTGYKLPTGETIAYEYDHANNRTKETRTAGTTTTTKVYAYDPVAINRLTSITKGSKVTAFKYDDNTKPHSFIMVMD